MKLTGFQIIHKISDKFVDEYVKDYEEELEQEIDDIIEKIVKEQLDEIKRDDYTKDELLEIIDDIMSDGLGLLHQRIVNDYDFIDYYYEYLYKK